ncbi:MAG: ArsR family transcriptional regulator [Deltaproteobacteria bacterium]|nr:ArsR family transcriptional regulator [Deltaproteobacteria bacterium]
MGRLMESWGFKRNMGRVWAMLYLSAEPLSAQDLRARLKLSAGAVSMTLNELERWNVVRKVWIQGHRREHFAAEVNLWKMISRVFNERERGWIVDAIEALEDALRDLDARRGAADPEERKLAEMRAARVRQLLDLAMLGKSLLDMLVSSARIDAIPLARLVLGR